MPPTLLGIVRGLPEPLESTDNPAEGLIVKLVTMLAVLGSCAVVALALPQPASSALQRTTPNTSYWDLPTSCTATIGHPCAVRRSDLTPPP